MFEDAFAYLATTPSYFGGPMSYGWATDDGELRQHKRRTHRAALRQGRRFPTRYWRPDVQVAAFALPTYVRELVEGRPHVSRLHVMRASMLSCGNSPTSGRQ